jgi:hypothetical protein
MPRLASVPDLEQELDRLYAVAPDQFVKERDALAARLRQAHQADAAAAVAKLRKPPAVASAANRLAREDPKAVAALLAAAERLRTAQERALGGSGGAAEVAEASAEERDRVRDLVTAARTRLDPPVPAAALERLGQTLRAAAAGNADLRASLEHGRLTGEVQATGFEAFEGVKVAPARRSRGGRARDDAGAAARGRLKELRAEARALAANARAADRAAAAAERAAAALRAEADASASAANRAADDVAKAESALHKKS